MAQMKYTDAARRIDEIIHRIENEEIDVDELSERVKEAVGLIKLCKSKIEKAEMEVKQAVEGFDAEEASREEE